MTGTRRLGIAASVALLHLITVYAALKATSFTFYDFAQPVTTVVVFRRAEPPQKSEARPPNLSESNETPILRAPPSSDLPRSRVPVAPTWQPPAMPPADLALPRIGRALRCNLTRFGELSEEDQVWCAERFTQLQPGVTLAPTPREAEIQQAWAMEIELRRQLPPCPPDSGINKGCVSGGPADAWMYAPPQRLQMGY